MTKKQLKDRWKSEDFINNLSYLHEGKISVEALNSADLRGIQKLGYAEPLCTFPTLFSTTLSSIDFSFGDGVIRIKDCDINHFSFEDFKFNRASFIDKSNIKNSNFSGSKMILDCTNVIFENCDFSQSIFKGGHKEWGFKRCKFKNCTFSGAYWKNTFLFACTFLDCELTDFKIENSLIRGFKINQSIDTVSIIFENCEEISGLVQLENK